MPNITLSVPNDIKREMVRHKELNWSEVARQAIEEKLRQLAVLDQLLAKSEVTAEDIEREAKEIKKRVLEKHQKNV